MQYTTYAQPRKQILRATSAPLEALSALSKFSNKTVRLSPKEEAALTAWADSNQAKKTQIIEQIVIAYKRTIISLGEDPFTVMHQ